METEFETRPARPGSLVWSEDNYLALVTPGVLHIFVRHDRQEEREIFDQRVVKSLVQGLTNNDL
jgi:hypothetical protein